MNAAEFIPRIQDDRPVRSARRYLPLYVVIAAVIAQLAVLNGIERLNPAEYN
jgi:hypothetical protein